MRILVHEYASGGGLAGKEVPPSLAREGAAILTALVADLAALGRHHIVTTQDARFPFAAPAGVEVVTLLEPVSPKRRNVDSAKGEGGLASPKRQDGDFTRGEGGRSTPNLDSLIEEADAVWLTAPESDRCLERLAATVEWKGKRLLGPASAAIREAANKAWLSQHLARRGVPHPTTRVLRSGLDYKTAAREIGYPIVVKPALGAGCLGVSIARDGVQLRRAVDMAHELNGSGPLLLQPFIEGVAASVSLLCDGRRALALTLNAQSVRHLRPSSNGRGASVTRWQPLSYSGGKTPLDHPLAEQALEAAVRTCESLPGLRGYVGVDLVLTKSEAIVIEVNPRMTTAYLGVREAFDENIAELTLAACDGLLPPALVPRRTVRFTAAGRISAA